MGTAFCQLFSFGLVIICIVAKLDPRVGQVGNHVYLVVGIFWAYWLATKRQQLRQKLGDRQEGTLMMDCLCYWCCSSCTIIQEARQVDEATNTATRCCMQLTKQQEQWGPAVGEPVATTGLMS